MSHIDKDENEAMHAIAHKLKEMQDDLHASSLWFEISAPSIRLIKESVNRPLTELESTKIAGDFLQAGTLLNSHMRRGMEIIHYGVGFVAHVMGDELTDELQEFLKGV